MSHSFVDPGPQASAEAQPRTAQKVVASQRGRPSAACGGAAARVNRLGGKNLGAPQKKEIKIFLRPLLYILPPPQHPLLPLSPRAPQGRGQRPQPHATSSTFIKQKQKTKLLTGFTMESMAMHDARQSTSQINTHTQRTTLAPQKKTVHIHAPAQPTVTTSRSAAVLPCGRPRAASGEAVLSERRLHPGGRYPRGHVDLGLCLLDQLARLVRSPRRPA